MMTRAEAVAEYVRLLAEHNTFSVRDFWASVKHCSAGDIGEGLRFFLDSDNANKPALFDLIHYLLWYIADAKDWRR